MQINVSFVAVACVLLGILGFACGRCDAQNSDTTFGWLVSSPPLPQGTVRANTIRAGRDAIRLMRKRDVAALYARLGEAETKNATQATWQQFVNGLKLANAAPVGELVTGSLDAPVYFTRCPVQGGKWQENIAITFASGRADKIARITTEGQIKPAFQDETIKFGRHVCDLIAKKDANALHALYTQHFFLKQYSPDELRAFLTREVTPEKPIGKRIADVVSPASVYEENALMYVAEFAQGPHDTRKIILMFTPNHKKVAAFYLIPGVPAAPQTNANVP